MSKTVQAVIDGKLTNEQLGGLTRRTNEIIRRINEGTLGYDWVMNELQRVTEGRGLGDGSQFQTWRTVKLGTHGTVEELKNAITSAGHNISDWSKDILGKPAFTLAGEESELELVKVTARELGFSKGATRKDIYNRAIEQGLMICPAEVGPQLRLQYADQPIGEWVIIAMEPIIDSGGDPGMFSVRRDGDGESWLNTYCGNPGSVWGADSVFVFGRRK